ncbi:MAG: NADH-quinone oxidoreductase subunit J [Gemmataceae bacterium]|nr:NADH-quinone oxidoreductase subunit J [Gemmataceae bacterium]
MTPLAAIPNTAAGQLVLAAVLAAAGFYLLLPRPRGRSCAGGTAALIAAVAVFGAWLHQTFGQPAPDLVGTVLFYVFAAGAVGFGAVLVVQRNPARGAIAFAFVVLSTCGLFLLLGAPFLAAATIIVYAGAIIVTFLFVLMLSHAAGPSDENDRSREPLFGSLAGFAFATLILFVLLHTHTAPADQHTLPAPVLTAEETAELNDIARRLEDVAKRLEDGSQMTNAELAKELSGIEEQLDAVVFVKPSTVVSYSYGKAPDEGSIPSRLGMRWDNPIHGTVAVRRDKHAADLFYRLDSVTKQSAHTFGTIENKPPLASESNRAEAVAALRQLRDEVRLLAGSGELPARNVGTIGLTLYSDHLFAVELAGTLLLIATIGAIAIAHRKGAAA